MPRASHFLDRFRRLVAPPGRPTEAVGVPAAGDDLAAELGPLLTELDAIGAEAARIVRKARADADARRERAAVEAQEIVAAARRGAGAELERAAAAVRDDDARPGAAPELARLARVREERVGALVAEVLECVRRTDP